MSIKKTAPARKLDKSKDLAFGQDYLEQAITRSTARAYRHDLRAFWAWAVALQLAEQPSYPVPLAWVLRYVRDNIKGLKADTVAAIMKQGVKVTGRPLALATIRRQLSSLSIEHSIRGVDNPCSSSTLHLFLRRAGRLKTARPKRRRQPITADVLKRILAACGSGLRGKRDRAILLVGFCGGGRRRSELAALRLEHLHPVKGGYVARLENHKTAEVTGEPLRFPIIGQAAKALDQWLKAARIDSGLVFRGIHRSGRVLCGMHPDTINRMVQRMASEVGYTKGTFSAHSLRAGFVTQAARQGIPLPEAMSVSGHRSLQVAYRYYREGDILGNRASDLLA